MKACEICGGAADLSIVARERMLGMGGEFRYDRCGTCGCVQLGDVPEDLGRYYPADYYAFVDPAPPSRARHLYRRVRDAILFGRARALGSLVVPFLPARFAEVRDWFTRTGAGRHARILDVGCGTGLLVRRLADVGFDRAMGVDLFLAVDIVERGRVLVRKGTIHDISAPYELIMFHHALEHIPDQRATLARAARLLVPGGWCLIRIPTTSSFAWEEYRDRWVQLDAPRHLFLHSVDSLGRLAQSVGLRLEQVVYDSTAFQFEGSELYRRDRPLSDLPRTAFTSGQRRRFLKEARRLNAAKRGDQAAFYLRKT